MHPLVQQIEDRFLPQLERLASRMRAEFPALRFNVWHSPTGTLTEYQGYDAGLECELPEAAHNGANNIVLSIDLCHLTSTPRLMADVMAGQSEVEFRDWSRITDWPEATPETVEELQRTFPTLVRAFESVVERSAKHSV